MKHLFLIALLYAPSLSAQKLSSETVELLKKATQSQNYKPFLQLLHQHPAIVDATDDTDYNLLMIALMQEPAPMPIIRELIKRTKDINHRDDQQETALMTAARVGSAEAVELLLARGAKVNVQDIDGNTPLSQAMILQNPRVIQLLLSHKANVNTVDTDGDTPLCRAILHDRRNHQQTEKTVRLLLEHGADIEGAAGTYCNTPLFNAVLSRNIPVTKVLLAHKANTEAMNQDEQKTPLMFAITMRKASEPRAKGYQETLLELIKILLEARANPNAMNDDGNTPLSFAIMYADAPAVRELLAHGAVLKAMGPKGINPLSQALRLQKDLATAKNSHLRNTPENKHAIDEIVNMLLNASKLAAEPRAAQAEARATRRHTKKRTL